MIARKSALMMATRFLDGLIAFIALFVISKYLSADAYGIVMFAMGFTGLFTIVTKLGLDTTHVKKISEGKDEGICNGTYYSIKISLMFLFVLIVFLFLFIWTNILNRGFESSTHELAIYIMIIYWSIMNISTMFSQTFRAKKEIAMTQIGLILGSVVRIILISYVAFFRMSAIELAYAYIGGEIAHMAINYILFKRRKHPLSKPSKKYAIDYSHFAFPLVIVIASNLLIKNADIVFIQLFWSAADVGYYTAGYKITNFIINFIGSLTILLLPTYSKYHSDGNKKALVDLTYKSERYLSMLIFPMIFGIIALAEPATRVLLNKWIDVVPVLRILPIYVLFVALESPYKTQFIGMNHPKLARNRVLIMVSINIILNLLLIPKDIQSIGIYNLPGLGAQGAVIATISAYFAGLIYSRIKSYQLTGVKGNWRIIFHAFSAIVMGITLYLILDLGLFTVGRWYHLLAISFFGLGIYLALLWILREFKIEDYNFIIDTLNIKKMYEYIRDELRKKE